MKAWRAVLLAFALCAPLPCFGSDSIFVQVPALLDPTAPIDPAVKRECGIEPLIGNNALAQIQVRYPGAGMAAGAEQAGAGKFVQLIVVSVQGVGGGNWSGAKAITVRAQLMQQGKEIASRVLRRGSRGGVWGGMSGTCPIMERIAVALGKDVSLWLHGVLIGKPMPETKPEED